MSRMRRKTSKWVVPRRILKSKKLIYLSLILCPIYLWAEPPTSYDLYWAFTHAFKYSGEGEVFEQRQKEIVAKMNMSRGISPEPIEVSISYLDDFLFDDDGKQEYELALGLPLWRWNQRTTRRNYAKSEQDGLKIKFQLALWELAGEVREAYWASVLARSHVLLTQQALTTSKDLAGDVQRRLKAGDLAEIDGLLAQGTVLEAKNELLEAVHERIDSTKKFMTMAGVNPPKEWVSEKPREAEIDSHPRIMLSRIEVQISQALLRRMQVERGENKQLEFIFTSERENSLEEHHPSFGIAFQLPLGANRENAAELSEAASELAEAEQHMLIVRRKVVRGIFEAEKELEMARSSQGLAEKQKRLGDTQIRLAQSAFDAGEWSLRLLLETVAKSQKTNQNVELRRIEVAHAISNLNHSRGLLPKLLTKRKDDDENAH